MTDEKALPEENKASMFIPRDSQTDCIMILQRLHLFVDAHLMLLMW